MGCIPISPHTLSVIFFLLLLAILGDWSSINDTSKCNTGICDNVVKGINLLAGKYNQVTML